MILKDLFQQLPEDFARRPIRGADEHPTNLPTFDPAYSKVVGTFDGEDVWGSREKRGFEIFGYRKDDVVLAYCIISENELEPNVQALREIWVNPEFRKRGYGSGLLLFILKKLKIKLRLTHDEIVSDAARVVILGLRDRIKIHDENGHYDTYDDILKNHTKTGHELTLIGEASPYSLFGSKMLLAGGRTTFEEHSLVDVGRKSDYD